MLSNFSDIDNGLIGIVIALLLVCTKLFRSYRTVSRNSWEPKALDTTRSSTLFIIDGCNGPIRLDVLCLESHPEPQNAVSLLHVVDGENKGDRINAIPELDRLLARDVFCGVSIYFDGLGNKAKANCTWSISPRLTIKITDTLDEADNVIVEEVIKRRLSVNTQARQAEESSLSRLLEEISETKLAVDDVYTIKRNSEGSGRSRRLLKPLTLLRPQSVFCIFGLGPVPTATRDATNLLTVDKLITTVEKTRLGMNETIVVTDDIFLRQRVVSAGGFVVTFEQLWDLLTVETASRKQTKQSNPDH